MNTNIGPRLDSRLRQGAWDSDWVTLKLFLTEIATRVCTPPAPIQEGFLFIFRKSSKKGREKLGSWEGKKSASVKFLIVCLSSFQFVGFFCCCCFYCFLSCISLSLYFKISDWGLWSRTYPQQKSWLIGKCSCSGSAMLNHIKLCLKRILSM